MTLNLWDIIEKSGLPPDNVAAVRHTLNHEWEKKCYEKGISFFEECQKFNPENYFHGKTYILSFIGGEGTTARSLGCYQDCGCISGGNVHPMPDFPFPEAYDSIGSGNAFHELVRTDYMSDLSYRLVIDWGKGVKNIVQYTGNALKKKAVIAIAPDPAHSFPGYDLLIWKFDEMSRYVLHPVEYAEICGALKKVNAVYLVTDTESGRFYVGSAYGKDGLYGRWLDYAVTKGGGHNQGLEKYLSENPEAYHAFQYSVLEVIPGSGIAEKDMHNALKMEQLYKRKLASVHTPWGLNEN